LSDININNMRGRGRQHDFCLNLIWYILFTVLLNNILIGASTLLPVGKIQLLRGGDSDGIKVHERDGWKRGETEETAFGLHLPGSRLKRVKRYESDRFSTYSESRKAYITEANRRHREEVARNKAQQKEMEERRRKRKDFSSQIIGVSCFVGLFVCCCCLGCFFKCKDYCSGSGGSNTRQSGAGSQQLQEVTTRNGAGSTQRSSPRTAREGGSPLLPEKPASAPPTDQNGPELPPSYATAMADSS